jgi:hypothetical protein
MGCGEPGCSRFGYGIGVWFFWQPINHAVESEMESPGIHKIDAHWGDLIAFSSLSIWPFITY